MNQPPEIPLSLANMLRVQAANPLPPDGPIEIKLANGGTLSSGWDDDDDPDRQPGGDYLAYYAPDGNEYLLSWAAISDPLYGRKDLSNFLLRIASALPDGGLPSDPT